MVLRLEHGLAVCKTLPASDTISFARSGGLERIWAWGLFLEVFGRHISYREFKLGLGT